MTNPHSDTAAAESKTQQPTRKSVKMTSSHSRKRKAIKNIGQKRVQQKSVELRKPRRFRPGTQALRQIRKFQKTTELLVPKVCFQRVVREIAGLLGEFRFTREALEALQTAAETHVTNMLKRANYLAIHAKRVTIYPKDMTALKYISFESSSNCSSSK
jgi:histone H3